jgi:hypothetical protein
MQIGINYGRERATFEVRDSDLLAVRRGQPTGPLPDPAAAVP